MIPLDERSMQCFKKMQRLSKKDLSSGETRGWCQMICVAASPKPGRLQKSRGISGPGCADLDWIWTWASGKNIPSVPWQAETGFPFQIEEPAATQRLRCPGRPKTSRSGRHGNRRAGCRVIPSHDTHKWRHIDPVAVVRIFLSRLEAVRIGRRCKIPLKTLLPSRRRSPGGEHSRSFRIPTLERRR